MKFLKFLFCLLVTIFLTACLLADYTLGHSFDVALGILSTPVWVFWTFSYGFQLVNGKRDPVVAFWKRKF